MHTSPVSVTPAAYSRPMPDSLSDIDRGILAIEAKWWRYSGAKEQAIRDELDLSATQFYQRLNALLETEAALAYDPILIKRLRRLRDQRRR